MPADTKAVRFLRNYTVQAEDGESFEEGKSYDLPPESAKHFVSRGHAEYVVADSKPAKGKKSEAVPAETPASEPAKTDAPAPTETPAAAEPASDAKKK